MEFNNQEKTVNEREIKEAVDAINQYLSNLDLKNIHQVHWKLRVIFTVIIDMLQAIEEGRVTEFKQH